jgi:hypothetical protein
MGALVETTVRKPRLTDLAREEVRILWQRHWWELSIITALLLCLLIQPFFTYTEMIKDGLYQARLSGPWSAYTFSDLSYLLLFSGFYWGLALWRGEARDQREYLLSAPETHVHLLLLRVTLGGLYLLVVTLVVWFIWIIALRIRVPFLETGLPFGLLPDFSWGSVLLGGLNAYLLASIVAMLSRDPLRWIILWVPLTLLTLNVSFVALRWNFLTYPSYVIFSPWGLMGGLGLPLYFAHGRDVIPAVPAVFLWFFMLSYAIQWAARWRGRE